ncbi:MAG: rod shape-determining protein MreC [Dehalococcoidia bacterium]|nr:rod shape-determining protein MreC [Dehalococcoidia bacterium]MCA9857534.1 rod shape-determining protein MreC [Dehalococcoidia bacterium]MCB9491927.1 rod shape-determining protein MreC [Dehalococcoidia bacterium]
MTSARSAAWFSGIFFAALLLLALSPLPVAGDLEARAGAAVAPAVDAVRGAISPVTDIVLHAGQISELSEENAALRQELSRTQADLASLREGRIALEQANALIASVGAEAGSTITATVILRDPAPGRQSVVLNQGSRAGVRVGQPVLGSGATLLGIVTEVNETRSRVRLITDRESAIAALLQSSRTTGSLVGDGRELHLDFVPLDVAVAPGDVVLTSALGGLLPPGLLVGRVSEVEAPGQELHQRIVVDPLGDLERIEQVLVMTGFRPGTDIAPASEDAN